MVLANNQNALQKYSNSRDSGTRLTVFSHIHIWVDLVLSEPIFGREPLPENYDPQGTDNTERDDLVYTRNVQTDQYWLTRRRAATALQGKGRNDKVFESITEVLCFGVMDFADIFDGNTQIIPQTTEEELMTAIIASSDLYVNASTNGTQPLLPNILTPSTIEPAYNNYWTRSDQPDFDVTDDTTWGRFRTPGRYRNYYDTPTWTEYIENDREIGLNTHTS